MATKTAPSGPPAGPPPVLDSKFEDEHVELEQVDKSDASPAYAPAYLSLTFGQTVKVFWRSLLFAIGVSLGAVFDCFALQVPNQIVANRGFIAQFGNVYGPDGETAVAIQPATLSMWSTVALSCTVGGLIVSGYIGDRFGRKAALWIMTVFMLMSGVLSVTAKDIPTWTARAALGGLAQGALQSSAIPYLSEIAPTKIRGMCLNLYVFFWAVGILAGGIALYIAEEINPDDYRLSFYGQFVFAAPFIVALVFVPESQWWYARKGKEAQAKNAMRRLYGNVESYDVEAEYAMMMKTIDDERATLAIATGGQPEWKLYLDCFRKDTIRRTFVALIPISTQAFSGVMLFYGYTTYFFAQAGFPRPFEANLIIGALQLVGTATSFFLLDMLGRRPLLIFGTGICAVCCWGLGGIAFASEPNGQAMLALCCLWMTFYSATLNSLGYAFVGEIPTQRLKSKTSAISFGIYAILSLIMAYVVPYMLSDLEWGWGLKTGLFFGGCTTGCFVIILFCAPETKGRSWQELDELFGNKVPAWRFSAYQTEKDRKLTSDAARVEGV